MQGSNAKTAERHIKAPENISGAVSTPKNAKQNQLSLLGFCQPTQLCSREIMGQYLFIGKSGIRHALGSFLTHSHCMAPAFSFKV